MDRPRNANAPYIMEAAALKQRTNYKTTYGDSFKKVKTEKYSPLIAHYYDFFNNDVPPNEDHSPYPMARYNVEPIYNKPYQSFSDRPGQRPDESRGYNPYNPKMTYYEKPTLKRDPFMEPLPLPLRGDIDRETDHSSLDSREECRREPSPAHQHQQQQRYDDQRPEGPPQEFKKVFCNKCFKSNCCMNKLTCGHQYCDSCMTNIPCQDRQFRDSIRWHYCCEICQQLTSEPKVVRLDPYGQRLLRYHDTDPFNHISQQR